MGGATFFLVPGQPMSVTGLPRIFWGPFKMGFPFQVFSTGRSTTEMYDMKIPTKHAIPKLRIPHYFFFHRDGGILHLV